MFRMLGRLLSLPLEARGVSGAVLRNPEAGGSSGAFLRRPEPSSGSPEPPEPSSGDRRSFLSRLPEVAKDYKTAKARSLEDVFLESIIIHVRSVFWNQFMLNWFFFLGGEGQFRSNWLLLNQFISDWLIYDSQNLA